MSYTDFGPPRRSRRRRNVVVLIVLLSIIGVLTLAVRYRTERRESIDYLATAEQVASQHAEIADRLGTLFQTLGQEERPEILLRLESLSAESREARRLLEDAVVTRPVAEVGGLMTVAVGFWDDGLSTIDDAVVAILDAEDGDLSGEELLRTAFDLLRVGDRAYAEVVEGVVGLDPEIVPVAFPAVSYTGDQFAALYDATIIAERLRQQGTLVESRDVRINGATIPQPVSQGVGEIWTIPASDEFSLEVTVSNTGNVVAENVTVTVILQVFASGETVEQFGQVIPSIEEGASASRLFENLDVEPAQVYTITATASFDDGVVDENEDDNTWSLVFERNAE